MGFKGLSESSANSDWVKKVFKGFKKIHIYEFLTHAPIDLIDLLAI